MPFTAAPKNINHFGINLTKDIQDLHTENGETQLRKIRFTKFPGGRFKTKVSFYPEIHPTQF